jgi:hypothetical protein
LAGVTLCGKFKQLARHDHQGAEIALGVIADGRDHLFGHQGGGAGLLQSMPQAVLKVLRWGAFDRQAHPHTAGKLRG